MENQTYSFPNKSLNDLKLDLKSYKTQQSLALQKDTRDPERRLTGLLLFFLKNDLTAYFCDKNHYFSPGLYLFLSVHC